MRNKFRYRYDYLKLRGTERQMFLQLLDECGFRLSDGSPYDRHLFDCSVRNQHVRSFFFHSRIPNSLEILREFPYLEQISIQIAESVSGYDAFRTLLNLKYLTLMMMELDEIPSAVMACRELIELDVSGNNLELLPKSILNLNKLEILHLKSNSFKRIPTILYDMNLQHPLRIVTLLNNPLVSKDLRFAKAHGFWGDNVFHRPDFNAFQKVLN